MAHARTRPKPHQQRAQNCTDKETHETAQAKTRARTNTAHAGTSTKPHQQEHASIRTSNNGNTHKTAHGETSAKPRTQGQPPHRVKETHKTAQAKTTTCTKSHMQVPAHHQRMPKQRNSTNRCAHEQAHVVVVGGDITSLQTVTLWLVTLHSDNPFQSENSHHFPGPWALLFIFFARIWTQERLRAHVRPGNISNGHNPHSI